MIANEDHYCNCKTYDKAGIGIGSIVYDYTGVKKPLKVYVIGDIHGGHEAVQKAEVKIKEAVSEKARILFTGDLLNYAIKDSVSFYHGAESPQIETERIKKLFKKYYKNIDGVVSGNHDQRSFKYSGLDTLKTICQDFGIAYHSNALVVIYKVGAWLCSGHRLVRNRHDKGPVPYKIFLTHSSRSGRKVGGKLAKVVDLQEVIDADIYLSGHSHDLSSHRGSKISISNSGILRVKEQMYVNCGSFQSYSGYAVSKNLPPAPAGCAVLSLHYSKFNIKLDL